MPDHAYPEGYVRRLIAILQLDNYGFFFVMPGLFRHPLFRKLIEIWFAARWTPEQVRGDGAVLASARA
ncbi:hypothetical protein C8J44_1358 [Sphingomonas sp. PP-CE-3A-406]|nr:hypothetical protein C8J44_1358 [Sphingomonas sp. PP-CE-3A-406]